MVVEFWPHRGTFDRSKKEKRSFTFLQQAIDFVVNSATKLSDMPPFTADDLYIHHYTYDYRVEKECFSLCAGRYYGENYIKQYGCPQCWGYLYFDQSPLQQMSAKALQAFLVKRCNIPADNIEIFDNEFCHFVNFDAQTKEQSPNLTALLFHLFSNCFAI